MQTSTINTFKKTTAEKSPHPASTTDEAVVHLLVLAHGRQRNIEAFCDTVNKIIRHGSTHEIRLLDFCMPRAALPLFLDLIATHQEKVTHFSPEIVTMLKAAGEAAGYTEPVPAASGENAASRFQHYCVMLPLGLRPDNHHGDEY